MQDLYDIILRLVMEPNSPSNQKLCVINTDNVPNNATLIRSYMLEIAREENGTLIEKYLKEKVAFLDSMVDRITSEREGSEGMIPLCEPTPSKALVLLDKDGDLPLAEALQQQPGVVIRTTNEQLQTDIALKLRVCNGTHTAIAHAFALCQYFQTDVLSKEEPGALFMKYLDSLVTQQIVPAAACSGQSIQCTSDEATAVWKDWRSRLIHPHFGLSSFFITQNGTAKGGIRWGPTVSALVLSSRETTAAMAFAYAVLLRWLTPITDKSAFEDEIFKGWMDGLDASVVVGALRGESTTYGVVEYADGLQHCANEGWYEYKCSLRVANPHDATHKIPLPQVLRECVGQRPNKCVIAVRAYLLATEGGNLSDEVASKPEFENLVHAVATFYSRLVGPPSETKLVMEILEELDASKVGGLIGFDTPCNSMMDYYMYLSGI
ncbi:MAG: hypothetical protein SGILL_003712 [Bacillariaceae sp.]